MRVAVNLRHFFPGVMGGGMESYVRDSVGALDAHFAALRSPLAIFADPSRFDAIAELAPTAELIAAPVDERELPPAAVATSGADVLFCPITFVDPLDAPLPTVVMVADIYPELEPQSVPLPYRELARQRLRPSTHRADVVLTMTAHTADQIAERHGIDRARIAVAPPVLEPGEPSSQAIRERVDRLGLAEPFVFYPARFYQHKNHLVLVRAISLLAERPGVTPQLVLTGADDPPAALVDEIERLGLAEHVRLLGQVDRVIVPELHRRAAALTFVSRFEGFGIPPVEAMLAGTPVLASRHPAVQEVVGGAALTVDENDPRAIAAGIERLLGEPALREQLVRTGNRQAQRFSRQASLSRHVDALERAVESAAQRPRISFDPPPVGIVTPALDSVDHIRATVESVLAQDYPRLRYVVMDGGSRDGTVDVLRSFGPDLDWTSGPDDGQSDAINRGIERVGGEIVAFLNSDDLYEPGAVTKVVERFRERPGAGMVHGRARVLDATGAEVRVTDSVHVGSAELAADNPIAQSASFYAGGAWRDLGGLDSSLHYALDYDLFIRIAAELPISAVDDVLASVRFHPAAKSEAQRGRCFRQTFEVARRHYGIVAPEWIDGYARWLAAGRPSAIDPVERTRRSIALELPLGIAANPRAPLAATLRWARHAGLVSSYEGRWSDGWISKRWRSELTIPPSAEVMTLAGTHHRPVGETIGLRLTLDGHRLSESRLTEPGAFSVTVPIPDALRGRRCEMLIETDRTWRAGNDPRRLSCQIEDVAFA